MLIQINMKKMPENCAECPFHDMTQHGEDGVAYPYCHALKQDRGYYFDPETKRFPNCPIEEEPEEKEGRSNRNRTIEGYLPSHVQSMPCYRLFEWCYVRVVRS